MRPRTLPVILGTGCAGGMGEGGEGHSRLPNIKVIFNARYIRPIGREIQGSIAGRRGHATLLERRHGPSIHHKGREDHKGHSACGDRRSPGGQAESGPERHRDRRRQENPLYRVRSAGSAGRSKALPPDSRRIRARRKGGCRFVQNLRREDRRHRRTARDPAGGESTEGDTGIVPMHLPDRLGRTNRDRP